MWGNDWASTRWLTSSRAVQSAFIAQNQHLNSAGVDFRALYDQSHSSNNSSRSHNHNNTSCSNCNGTGVDPSPNTGGSAVGWVAYYNRPKSKCPYCNRYSSHFHDKCARCNTPSRWYSSFETAYWVHNFVANSTMLWTRLILTRSKRYRTCRLGRRFKWTRQRSSKKTLTSCRSSSTTHFLMCRGEATTICHSTYWSSSRTTRRSPRAKCLSQLQKVRDIS